MESLNPAQQQAVHYLQGPCLVLAGAGSGKTRVIAHKIAHLLEAGHDARSVAAITFTNKAAREMRERVHTLVGQGAARVMICTFHALGVRILREDGQLLGLKPHFSILSSDDVQRLLKDCRPTTDSATLRQWQWQISRLKGQAVADPAKNAADDPALAELMRDYQQRLTAWQSVDFDDLIILPWRLLREHLSVREKWQQRFTHVLVDEYQDTNAAQYELLKLLIGEEVAFTAVGDDDQSIYGWRGATLDNLRRLPTDFPALKVVKLEQNYRSTEAILRAANQVMEHNPRLYTKQLKSRLGEGDPVRVLDCDHEQHEAARIVSRLRQLHGDGAAWSDCAVLYRANHQSRVLEQALRRAHVPYRVSGGQSFFDRAEIRDLCAWLRLWLNEDDDPAFLRAVTTPRRGIGAQTLSQLGDFAASRHLSLFASLSEASLLHVLPRRGAEALHEFGREVLAQREGASAAFGAAAAREFLQDWLAGISYRQHLQGHAESAAQAEARWDNVQDFCDWMASRCTPRDEGAGRAGEASLRDVAQTVALVSSLDEEQADRNQVTLSTLHAAKGLEWSHVMLAGVTEGLLPFCREGEALLPGRLEEERRLMYVGITRARRSLVVSWTRRRKHRHQWLLARPSRFIAEMQLDQQVSVQESRARLAALRVEFARRAAGAQTPS